MLNNMKNKKVLVVVGHPDDEVLICGGTIRRFYEEGAEIALMTFTNGADARAKSVLGGSGKNRIPLVEEVSKILGISQYKCFDLPDNQLDTIPMLELAQSIEKFEEEKKFIPDVVITHTLSCLNIDHQLVSKAVLTCFRPKARKIIILSGEVVSSTEWSTQPFIPDVFIDVEKYIDKKKEALEVYIDELRPPPHPRNWENIYNKMKVSGSEAGLNFAERFALMRAVI